MGKKGRSRQKKEKTNSKTSDQYDDALSSDDMHDEIDAFHKQRDIVPLDINDEFGESDEDEEQPVFDLKGTDNDEDELNDDDDNYDDDSDDGVNDLTAKIIRQRRYLRAKFGGGEDEMHHDDDEDEEDYKPISGGKKFRYGADNRNFELQSSDDEALKEEEELAKQWQREREKFYTEEDYGLVGLNESSFKERDLTNLTLEDTDITYKVEDLHALSKDEQLNILNRSDPELVFWLSELNEAHDKLECKINPFLSKVKDGEIAMEGFSYFELKKVLMLSYCQAITFYLLLKSEGKPVHDHPVMARLEEIKKLLDQIKKLDAKHQVELDKIVEENHGLETVLEFGNENARMADSFTKNQELPLVSDESPKATLSQEAVEMQKVNSLKDTVNEERKHKHQHKVNSLKDTVNEERKHKHQHKDDHIGMQSLEMLKVRALLEEKLKQKGLYSSITPKTSSARKRLRPFNGQLETYDDFDDDAADVERAARLGNGLGSGRIAQFVNVNQKKPKVVSGDDDLPKRDDIGERRRKHELRVLAGAGLKSEDDVDEEIGDLGSDELADEEDGERGDSENELYEQTKQQRAAKMAAKAEIYSRNSAVPSLPDTLDGSGRRPISYEMEKNRGLTRYRKKLSKNPRKKYKEKHKKALKNRSGQVRSIKKPTGPYGGESSGINQFISRSVRFKS